MTAIITETPNNTLKLNSYNLNTLHNNISDVIQKKQIKPSIKKLMDIYEQSTQASTDEEITEETNPTKILIEFLINRNKNDVIKFNLKHFKNIRCKDINNKSCIVPIYNAPIDREELENARYSNLLIHTINNKYFIFIRDIYEIKYMDLMERLDKRYKLNVGLFKE